MPERVERRGMSRKKQKMKPDVVLKNYWNSNAEFADLFNAVLFQGKQIIQPEDLESDDTNEATLQEHGDSVDSLNLFRDTIKICKKSEKSGIQFVLLGMEHQEHIHYAMPMRVMGMDYSLYKKQYDSNARKYKTSEEMTADEFLSHMKKDDKFIPVITVVVYYGKEAWDGAKSLHEMLELPDEWADYVNDYKMLLVEARKSNLVFHNMNNRHLFGLLEILLEQGRNANEVKNRAIAYADGNDIETCVAMAAAGAAKCNIDYQMLSKKEGVNMGTVFEELAKENKELGKAEGIITTCMELKISKDDIIQKLKEKLNVSEKQAQEYYTTFAR